MVPCTGRQILNHVTTSDIPPDFCLWQNLFVSLCLDFCDLISLSFPQKQKQTNLLTFVKILKVFPFNEKLGMMFTMI